MCALALRYAPGLAATLSLLTLGKLCAVGLPWFIKHLVDTLATPPVGAPGADPRLPLALIAGYGLALLGSVAFNELKQVLSARLTLRFIQELSQAALSHLLRLPYPFLVGQKSGLVTRDYERGQRGIQVLSEVLLYSLLPALVELALVFGYLALNHAPWLVGWVALTVLAHVLIALGIAGRWSVFRERYNRAESHCHQRLSDSLINIESVKLFGNEDHETAEYIEAYRGYRREYVAAMRYCAYYQTTQQLLLVISVAIVLWSGYRDVLAGAQSVGDLVMLNALVLQVYLPLNSLGGCPRMA